MLCPVRAMALGWCRYILGWRMGYGKEKAVMFPFLSLLNLLFLYRQYQKACPKNTKGNDSKRQKNELSSTNTCSWIPDLINSCNEKISAWSAKSGQAMHEVLRRDQQQHTKKYPLPELLRRNELLLLLLGSLFVMMMVMMAEHHVSGTLPSTAAVGPCVSPNACDYVIFFRPALISFRSYFPPKLIFFRFFYK